MAAVRFMTMDRRFPWMDRIDGLPRAVRDGASAVCRRTMLSCAWNRREGHVFFYKNGDLAYGIFGCPVDVVATQAGIDSVVRTIFDMRRPWESKERDLVRGQAAKEAAEKAELDGRIDAIENDAKPYAAHVVNKMKMGKHSKPSVLV